MKAETTVPDAVRSFNVNGVGSNKNKHAMIGV